MCIDMRTDMCIDVCIDMYIDMCIDAGASMCVDIFVDATALSTWYRCVAMCVDTYVGMYMAMCIGHVCGGTGLRMCVVSVWHVCRTWV